MAKNDQEEALDKIMSATLTRTIDFLKFAEAKNAALLTFCSAWVLALSNLLLTKDDLPTALKYAAFIAIPLFLIAALISMSTFLPELSLKRLGDANDRPKNTLFFGHIASMEAGAYRDLCKSRYMPPENQSATDHYLTDLSVQTVVNGQITNKKFARFNFAAYTVIAALVVFGAGAATWGFRLLAWGLK